MHHFERSASCVADVLLSWSLCGWQSFASPLAKEIDGLDEDPDDVEDASDEPEEQGDHLQRSEQASGFEAGEVRPGFVAPRRQAKREDNRSLYVKGPAYSSVTAPAAPPAGLKTLAPEWLCKAARNYETSPLRWHSTSHPTVKLESMRDTLGKVGIVVAVLPKANADPSRRCCITLLREPVLLSPRSEMICGVVWCRRGVPPPPPAQLLIHLSGDAHPRSCSSCVAVSSLCGVLVTSR
jgi:hypothetical protein